MNELKTKYQNQLKALESTKSELIGVLASKLANSEYLKATLVELDNSDDLTLDSCGEVNTYIRFDASKLIDVKDSLEVEALEVALEYAQLDLENDALLTYIGPCIHLYNDGTVYCAESNKQLDGNYRRADKQDLDAMLEAHMESMGVYPWIVEHLDNYGLIRSYKMGV